jgi:N-acetylmuramic acid 6-phosphate etherase
VGPEFVTGSTRMKAGTAQKLVLNMISTSAMISLGRVKGNKMVDMQLTNNKLIDRGTRMIMEELSVDQQKAEESSEGIWLCSQSAGPTQVWSLNPSSI